MIILFGPVLLLVAFPENPIVTFLFGSYRLFLFYGVAFGCLAILERETIRRWAHGNRR